MHKIFAIFVAITLWNASALGAEIEFDPSDKPIIDKTVCPYDAPYSTREDCEKAKDPNKNQVCCSKSVTTISTTDYYCDAGYTKTLSRCTKTTETTDATGYKKTVETCDADKLIKPSLNITCYYLQDSANGYTNCFQEMVK